MIGFGLAAFKDIQISIYLYRFKDIRYIYKEIAGWDYSKLNNC